MKENSVLVDCSSQFMTTRKWWELNIHFQFINIECLFRQLKYSQS